MIRWQSMAEGPEGPGSRLRNGKTMGDRWETCQCLFLFHKAGDKHGYGACRSAALSAFLKVDKRHSFFIFMRDAMVQLCCCTFYKAFLSDPIGSSQELTLRATIAILGSVSSRQLLFHDVPCAFNFLEDREYVGCMISGRCYNVSGTSWKLLEEDVTTYQERLASYLKKMLQRIRNVLEVTWRKCYNVSGTFQPSTRRPGHWWTTVPHHWNWCP